MPADKVLTSELSRVVLALSAALTVALYAWPLGRTIGYPLILLSTLAHEMGHGIAALIIGGHFSSFQLYPNGSGVAHTAVSGRFAEAFVCAGGLVGPSFAAIACFWMGKRPARARFWLGTSALVLGFALVAVVRNAFAWAFVAALAVCSAAIALRGGPRLSQLSVVFVGTQLALSVYSDRDYLFSRVAETSDGPMPSDVALMSEALFLPYWFWGGLCGAVSIAVLVFGLYYYWRQPANA